MPAKVTYIASKIAKFQAKIVPYKNAYDQVKAFHNKIVAFDPIAEGMELVEPELSAFLADMNDTITKQMVSLNEGIDRIKEQVFDGLNIPVTVNVTLSGFTITPQIPNPLNVNDDTTSLLKESLSETLVTPTPGANSGGPVVYTPLTGLPNAVVNPLL